MFFLWAPHPLFGGTSIYCIDWNLSMVSALYYDKHRWQNQYFFPEISWIAQKWLKISYFQVVLLLVNFYFHMLQGDYFYPPWNSGAINCQFMMRFVNFFWLIHHCLALNCTWLCTFNTLIGGNLSNFLFEFVDIITTDQNFKLKFQFSLSLSLSASTISEKILISNCLCMLVYMLCLFLLPYVCLYISGS